MTHFCTSKTTFHKPLSNDWFVLSVGDAKLSLLQEVVTHLTELRKPPFSMTVSVCPWFVLIMMLINFVDIALFAMPFFVLYVNNIVSFLLLTSIIIAISTGNLTTYILHILMRYFDFRNEPWTQCVCISFLNLYKEIWPGNLTTSYETR